jgi:hypothetical protein
MYYLFLLSIISTIIIFILKYEMKNTDGYRNCSEYIDPYGNMTIETHKYIYKMSRTNGRLFRKIKGTYNPYKIIFSKCDKLMLDKNIEYDIVTGKSKFIK